MLRTCHERYDDGKQAACHRDLCVRKQIQSGEEGSHAGSTGRSFEPDLEEKEQSLVTARQRALRAEGRQTSLETPEGTVVRAGPVRAEAQIPLRQEKKKKKKVLGQGPKGGCYQLYASQGAVKIS